MSGGGGSTIGALSPGGLFGAAGGALGSGSLGIGDNSLPGQMVGALTGSTAARAQGQIAQSQLEEQQRTRGLATAAAAPSISEIQQMDQAVQLNTQDIARKQKLLDSSDPALIEAGHQALSLLQGKNAPVLAPMQAQQQLQRQQLQNKLQQQLGAGWATSTAGQQAMAAFDNQAAMGTASAQQSYLGNLLGTAANTSSSYGMQNSVANTGTLAGLYGQQSNRAVSAINSTPITAAGAQFVGDLQSARGMQNLMGNLTQGGLAYATGGASAKPGSGGGSSFLYGT